MEKFIKDQQQAKLQYTAPDRHCHQAEKAVQTYKAMFKSGLASLPKQFPIAYWFRLLDQTDISVNIVRPSRQNSLLLAGAAMEGELHFDATPLAPPGSEMMMHQNQRGEAALDPMQKGLVLGALLEPLQDFPWHPVVHRRREAVGHSQVSAPRNWNSGDNTSG